MTPLEIFKKHGRAMDTAPRDGTVFQVYHEHFGVRHANAETLFLIDTNTQTVLLEWDFSDLFKELRWLPIHAEPQWRTDEPPKDGSRFLARIPGIIADVVEYAGVLWTNGDDEFYCREQITAWMPIPAFKDGAK